METIILILIIAAAVAFAARSIYRKWYSKTSHNDIPDCKDCHDHRDHHECCHCPHKATL